MRNLGRLGSFELHGVSNTFGNQLSGFGSAASDLPRNKKYFTQVAADLQLAQSKMQTPALMGAPQNWQYWEFKGKPSVHVVNVAPAKMAELHKKIGAGGSGSTSSSSSSSGGSNVNAGEVLTGIAAILAPLTQAGVGIYGAQQAAKAARRSGGGGAPEPDYSQDYQQEAPKSNMGLIIGVVAVILLLGVGFMMMQNKQGQAPMYGPSQRPMYGPVQRPGYKSKKRKKSRKRRK